MRVLLLFAMALTMRGLLAQPSDLMLVSSCGQHFQNASHQLSFSVGETVVATLNTGNSILTQGFHQSFLAGIGMPEQSEIAVIFYPNPVTDILTVRHSLGYPLSIKLFDMRGRLLFEGEGKPESLLSIDMGNYASGSYQLAIFPPGHMPLCFQFLKK